MRPQRRIALTGPLSRRGLPAGYGTSPSSGDGPPLLAVAPSAKWTSRPFSPPRVKRCCHRRGGRIRRSDARFRRRPVRRPAFRSWRSGSRVRREVACSVFSGFRCRPRQSGATESAGAGTLRALVAARRKDARKTATSGGSSTRAGGSARRRCERTNRARAHRSADSRPN